MGQSPSVGATFLLRFFNLREFYGTLGFITTFSIQSQIKPLHDLPLFKIRLKIANNKVPH
jgi:hypothetical protein